MAIEIRQIKCPSCNGGLNLTQKKSKIVSCQFCGSVIDLKQVVPVVLEKLRAKRYPPRSFLKLGMIGQIEGKKYQIIARSCYDSVIKEWDDEDNRYYTEAWDHDTWLLVDENRTFRYLSEDKEGYDIAKSFVPSNPSIPNNSQQYITFHKNGSPRRINERATSTLTHFEGEFSWTPKLRDILKSAECDMDNFSEKKRMCVEWSIDHSTGTVKEAEFFTSKSVTKLELAKAFDAKKVIEQEERKIKKAKDFKLWGIPFAALSLIFLLLTINACSKEGTIITQHSIPVASINNSQITYGPFQLKNKGALHRMEMSTNFSIDSWFWAGAELLDENKQVVNNMNAEFYRESGRDSDGAWVETSKRKRKLFKLKNPGTYFLRLRAEIGTSKKNQLRANIREGLTLARFYILGGLFCFLYSISIIKFKKINPLFVLLVLFTFTTVMAALGKKDE